MAMTKKGTANKKLIKKINKNAILNVIREKGTISRADIAKELHLNPATVSSNVTDLIEEGLVLKKGSGQSNGGRRPLLLELNSENVYVIGVYTEISSVLVGLVNLKGEVVLKQSFGFQEKKYKQDHGQGQNQELDKENRYILDTIIAGIEVVIKQSEKYTKNVIGIGVGLHGLVDPINGKSIFAPGFNWHNVDVGKEIQSHFDVDTQIDNDVRAMALGEKWYGKNKGSNNFLLIHIGEGVGGAILTQGKLYYGTTFGAGEIGHIKVTQRAIKCNCGNYGCLTTVASEEGIVNRMKAIMIKNGGQYSNVDLKKISITDIVDMAKSGDKNASIILQHTADYIGRAIGTIINLFNPERVFLTGKLLDYEDDMMIIIKNSAKKQSIIDNYEKTKISKVSIEKDLEIIGASTLIVDKIFSV